MEHLEKTPAVSSSLKMGICLSFAGLLVLAACDMQNERPAPRPVSFNPQGTAPAALPAANIVWYQVESDSAGPGNVCRTAARPGGQFHD